MKNSSIRIRTVNPIQIYHSDDDSVLRPLFQDSFNQGPLVSGQ